MFMHRLWRFAAIAAVSCSLPALGAALPGSIEGTVTFYGDNDGPHPIEVAAHLSTSGGPPVTSTLISTPGGPYAISVEDGTYYLAAVMDRNGSGGPPDPEDTVVWYDGNGDGYPDAVVVSGGATVTGKNIALGFLYVDAAATGANNGTSWADAYTNLGTAIAAAVSGLEVWVAQGTYVPGSTRTSTFSLKRGVQLYGGFAGNEVLRSQRHPTSKSRTILSGEIGTAATTDNVYHVVSAGSGSNETAVLDGFEIRGGRADVVNHTWGGGLRADPGGVTVINCTFRDNYAQYFGGGVAGYNGGKVNVYNSEFINNSLGPTTSLGGGYFSQAVDQTVANSVFRGNTALQGAAIFIDFGGAKHATFTNLTIYGNTASQTGGGIYSQNSVVPYEMSNSIVWGNVPNQLVNNGSGVPSTTYSDVQGGYAGTGNINADPLFVNAAAGDLTLQVTSPAIDAGNNSAVPLDIADVDEDHDSTEVLPLDAGHSWRFFDVPSKPDTGIGGAPIVDMGAFETTDVVFRDGFEG